MSRTVLVLTATGTTGAATVNALLARGATVRAASRNPAAATFPVGVTPVRFDLDDRSTWAAALTGIDALYLATPPFRDDEYEVISALIAAAREAGVTRIVKLSAMGVDADPTSTHRRLELLVEASGAQWIHLRPTFFMENFVEFYGGSIKTDGAIYLPAGTGETGFVAAADIGEAAATALLGDRTGEAWILTGPESLDHDRVAADLSAALGRPIRYVDVPPEAFDAAMAESGAPPLARQTMGGLYAMVRQGWTAGVVPTLPELTGKPATRFADWARTHASAWS